MLTCSKSIETENKKVSPCVKEMIHKIVTLISYIMDESYLQYAYLLLMNLLFCARVQLHDS